MNRVFSLLIPVFALSASCFGQYAITTNGLPIATVNQTYATTVQTNSPAGATACTIVSGVLPTGMAIQTNGTGCLISGTPNIASTANFTMTVSNNQGQTTPSQSFALAVFGITSSSLPTGSVNFPYSFQFQANGGAKYQWSLLSGSLPAGLLLDSTGYLAGTLQSSGVFSFTLRVTDVGSGLTDTRGFSITVGGSSNPPGKQFQIISSSLPDAGVNQTYSATIQTSGGVGNLNGCLLVQGAFPPGISMSPVGTSCVLAGTPSNQGTYQFQVVASDSQGQMTSAVLFTINVGTTGSGPGGLTITTALIPNGTTASPYLPNGSVFTFTATGGTGFYTWSLENGSLPTGLSLASNGTLTGTPTLSGSFNFTVHVVSGGVLTSLQQTASKSFLMTINSGGLTIVEPSLPSASTGQSYSFPLHASGGTAPYHWSLGSTTLQGFTIDANSGVISGTTQTGGTYSFPVTVSDGAGRQVTSVFSLVVSTPFSILNSSLANGLPYVGYNQTLQASGGQAPYSWTITSGSLPPGVILTLSGAISGVPTANGQYTITIRTTDAAGRSATKIFTIVIGDPGPVQISTNSLPDGAVGTQYSQVVTAAGGQNPYSWSITAGTLPPGLALATTTGTIQGTPTQGGTFSFSIQATDAIGNVASKALSISIPTSGFSVVPNQLSFAYLVGGTQPSAQQANVSSSISVAFNATTSAAWLSVSTSSGTTPARLTISVNPVGLAAGVYNGSVIVSPSGISDPPQVISVTLAVSTTSGLTVSSSTLSFTYQSNGAVPPSLNLTIGSSGAALSFTVATSGGSWLIVNPPSGITPATLNVSTNPVGLAPGTYQGSIMIFGPGGSQQVSVTLTVLGSSGASLTLSRSTLVFAYQLGGAIPPPQTVTLGSGTPVTFSAASGSPWLTVVPNTGATPATLSIGANPSGLAPGDYTGAIVITAAAANSPLTLPVAFTVSSQGVPLITTVVNAGSYVNGPVAPGEIVAIGGASLGPLAPAFLTLDQNGKVSTSLSGVQVLFNGIPAPLTYVSASQINAVVPYEIAGALSLSVVVKFQNLTSMAYLLSLSTTAPGLFTLNASGTGPGAILNPDNTTNSPGNPVRKGAFVVLYATGEGQTTPPGVTGRVTTVSAVPPLTPQPLLPVTVSIGGQPATVIFFGEAPGVVAGVMQINVQIPVNTRSGDLPIDVSVGANRSQSGVTVSIQ